MCKSKYIKTVLCFLIILLSNQKLSLAITIENKTNDHIYLKLYQGETSTASWNYYDLAPKDKIIPDTKRHFHGFVAQRIFPNPSNPKKWISNGDRYSYTYSPKDIDSIIIEEPSNESLTKFGNMAPYTLLVRPNAEYLRREQ